MIFSKHPGIPTSIAVMVTLAVLLIAYWAGSDRTSDPRHDAVTMATASSSMPTRPQSSETMPSLPDQSAPIGSKLAVNARQPSNASIASRFNNATSYRAFLADALAHPEDGGLTYTMFVLQECKRFNARAPLGPESSQAQQNAVALMTTRCDLTREDILQAMNAALHSNGVAVGSDPALSAVLSRGAGEEGKARFAGDLIASRDPVRLAQLLTLNAQPTSDGSDPPLYFDGVTWSTPGERQLIQDAFLIAQCSFGMACDSQSHFALTLCAERGWCGDSVKEEVVMGHASSGSQENAAQLSALADKLVLAIRGNDVERFVERRRHN